MSIKISIRFVYFLLIISLFVGCNKSENNTQPSEIPLSNFKEILKTTKSGDMIISPQFDDAGNFYEDLAAVRIGDNKTGKYGFIDKQGKMVINLLICMFV